jgi:hypothetical protein
MDPFYPVVVTIKSLCPEKKENGQDQDEKQRGLEAAVKKILEYVGEDPG